MYRYMAQIMNRYYMTLDNSRYLQTGIQNGLNNKHQVKRLEHFILKLTGFTDDRASVATQLGKQVSESPRLLWRFLLG